MQEFCQPHASQSTLICQDSLGTICAAAIPMFQKTLIEAGMDFRRCSFHLPNTWQVWAG